MAGAINGNVTATKAFTGPQPRSIAASSRLRSMLPSRDCTITATKHIVSVVWAIVTVQNPRSAPSATNSNNSDRPVITSGITSGAYNMPENSVRPLNRSPRTSASAASVPSTAASVAETAATRRLVAAAANIASSLKNAVYQRNDQPPQTVTSCEALNE